MVEPVFMYPLVDQIVGFEQVSVLTILQHLLSSYKAIDESNLEENYAKMIGTYYPGELLSRLVYQLGKGRELVRAGGQTI